MLVMPAAFFPACLAAVCMCSNAGSVFKPLVTAGCVSDAMACAGPCHHLVLSGPLVPFTSDEQVRAQLKAKSRAKQHARDTAASQLQAGREARDRDALMSCDDMAALKAAGVLLKFMAVCPVYG